MNVFDPCRRCREYFSTIRGLVEEQTEGNTAALYLMNGIARKCREYVKTLTDAEKRDILTGCAVADCEHKSIYGREFEALCLIFDRMSDEFDKTSDEEIGHMLKSSFESVLSLATADPEAVRRIACDAIERELKHRK